MASSAAGAAAGASTVAATSEAGPSKDGPKEPCTICLELPQERGTIDSCDHVFCFSCIKQWAGVTNLCPVCRLRFSTIRRPPPPDAAGSPPTAGGKAGKAGKRRGPARSRTRKRQQTVVRVRKKDQKVAFEDTGLYDAMPDSEDEDIDDGMELAAVATLASAYTRLAPASEAAAELADLIEAFASYAYDSDYNPSGDDNDDNDDTAVVARRRRPRRRAAAANRRRAVAASRRSAPSEVLSLVSDGESDGAGAGAGAGAGVGARVGAPSGAARRSRRPRATAAAGAANPPVTARAQRAARTRDLLQAARAAVAVDADCGSDADVVDVVPERTGAAQLLARLESVAGDNSTTDGRPGATSPAASTLRRASLSPPPVVVVSDSDGEAGDDDDDDYVPSGSDCSDSDVEVLPSLLSRVRRRQDATTATASAP